MEKRQGLVPLAVLLGALALLLACSRLTNVPGAPNPTSPPASSLVADKLFWDGWERASWVATVVGLTVGFIALAIAAYEQIRISADVRRRPLLVFGFESERNDDGRTRIWESSKQIEVRFAPGAQFSEPVMLRIAAGNLGDRVATNILWNIDLPLGPDILNRTARRRRYMREPTFQRIIPAWPDLNPDDVNVIDLLMRMPATLSSLRIAATASCAEAREIGQVLTVSLERQDVQEAPRRRMGRPRYIRQMLRGRRWRSKPRNS